MARYPGGLLSALLLLTTIDAAGAADRDFPWAGEARGLAPKGWLGGQVIGFDPTAMTGVIAIYPAGDADPATKGKALDVKVGDGVHPEPSFAGMRDRKPGEHVFFQTNPAPWPEDDFQPAPGLPDGATACSVGAWTNDPDPRGLNLRAEPSGKSRIVARLPHLASPYGIEFRVIGFKDGWFLIENSENPDYEQTAPKGQRIYTGRGWVSARLIMSSIASQNLLSSPHYDASVVLPLSGTLGDTSYGPDSVPIRRILACNRKWTLVEVEDPPTKTRHTGWVERLCSNQVTTCP